MRLLALALVLAACGEEKPSDPTGGDDTDTDVVTDVPTETGARDTGGGDAPAATELPTDVDADCWSWGVWDDGVDGEGEMTVLTVFEADGLLPTHYDYDYDLDGRSDYLADLTYDADGRLLRETADENGDGQPEEITEREYDADGFYTRYSDDVDGDGDWDYVYTYTRDGDHFSQIEMDEGDDGTVDFLYTYTYDDQGYRLSSLGDDGPDGTVDTIGTYVWDPDYLGYAYTFDDGADGEVEESYVYRYDADFYLVHYYHDSVPDAYTTTSDYTYTVDGDVAGRDTTWDDNGTPYYAYHADYAYQDPGMVATEATTYSLAPQGWGDELFTTTWTCPGGHPRPRLAPARR